MTIRYAFATGLVVRRGERTFEFERRLNDNTLIFIDQLDKSPHRWPISKVYRDISDGHLHVVRGESTCPPNQSEGLPLIFDVDSLPDRYKVKIQLAHDYIARMRRMGITRGMRRQIERAIAKIAQERKEEPPFASSTIMVLVAQIGEQ